MTTISPRQMTPEELASARSVFTARADDAREFGHKQMGLHLLNYIAALSAQLSSTQGKLEEATDALEAIEHFERYDHGLGAETDLKKIGKIARAALSSTSKPEGK